MRTHLWAQDFLFNSLVPGIHINECLKVITHNITEPFLHASPQPLHPQMVWLLPTSPLRRPLEPVPAEPKPGVPPYASVLCDMDLVTLFSQGPVGKGALFNGDFW